MRSIFCHCICDPPSSKIGKPQRDHHLIRCWISKSAVSVVYVCASSYSPVVPMVVSLTEYPRYEFVHIPRCGEVADFLGGSHTPQLNVGGSTPSVSRQYEAPMLILQNEDQGQLYLPRYIPDRNDFDNWSGRRTCHGGNGLQSTPKVYNGSGRQT